MSESYILHNFWPEAIATTNVLKSHIKNFQTHSLQPWNFVFYVYLSKQKRYKLDPRAVKYVFVGYGKKQKGV